MDEHTVLWTLHLNTLEVVVSIILYNWVVGDAVDCGRGVANVEAQWARAYIVTTTINIQVALAGSTQPLFFDFTNSPLCKRVVLRWSLQTK